MAANQNIVEIVLNFTQRGMLSILGLLRKGLGPIVLAATAASTAIGYLGGKAVATARYMLELNNSLSGLNVGSIDSAPLESVRKTANELGIGLVAAAADFKTLAQAAKGTDLAGKQTEQMFADVARACKVLDLSARDTNAVFSGMAGIIRKGTIGVSDFQNAFGKRIPDALGTAAKSMGMTRERFAQALKGGQIAVKDFLPAFSAELRKGLGDAADGAIVSLEAGWSRIGNSMTRLSATLGELLDNNAFVQVLRESIAKGMDAIAEYINGLSDNLSENENAWHEWINTTGQSVIGVGKACVATANVVYGAFELIIGSARAVGAGFEQMYSGVLHGLAAMTDMAARLSFGESAQQLRDEAAAHREKAKAIGETARQLAAASQENFKTAFGGGSEALTKMWEELDKVQNSLGKISAGPIKNAMKDAAGAAKDGMGQIRQYTEQELKAAAKAYKKYADDVKRLNEDISGRRKSLKAELQDMAGGYIKNDARAWLYQLQRAREYEAAAKSAAKEARAALSAGDAVTADAKWKEAAQYADDAKAAYKGLNHEVKVNGQVVVDEYTALRGAMNGVKRAGELGISILKEQKQASEEAMSALEKQHGFDTLTKDMDEAQKKWVEGWRKMRGEVEDTAKVMQEYWKNAAGFWTNTNDAFSAGWSKGTDDFEREWNGAYAAFEKRGKEAADFVKRAIDKAAEDRQTTIRIRTLETKRWGGLIGEALRLAVGGKLPGYGGGDRVPAMLEPGEFVVRKEAVRRFGVGFLDAINTMNLSRLFDLSAALPAIAPMPSIAAAAPGRTVNINLNLGGETWPMQTDERTAKKIERWYALRSSNRVTRNDYR